jgi:hypothetical protein
MPVRSKECIRSLFHGIFFPCLLLPTLHAQRSADAVQKVLPPEARVIETADAAHIAGKPRVIVLWMEHPTRHSDGFEYCGTSVEGSDFYEGPTRLSLIDSATPRLLNTVKILAPRSDSQGMEDSFSIPLVVSTGYYFVPRPNASGQGVPEILHLRDLTGEGKPAQFALFLYEACGLVYTGAFGFQPRADRVVQYPVEQNGSGVELWIQQVFAAAPIRPGHWNFTWGPGHGSDDIAHEDVTFDRSKQVFIEKATVSQPGSRGK